jgi:hypothetical protein
MRARLVVILLALTLAVPTRADPPKLVVFDLVRHRLLAPSYGVPPPQ